MGNFHRRLVGSLVTTAVAGTAAAQGTAELEGVTVTAKGYEAPAAETPRSVTVLDAETIQRREARSVGDLLRGEPGLATAVDGSVGVDPVIRGLKRDQILVLVDGVRVNAMQPPARGSLASYVNVDLIERIEVVRGPGSVLYGAGAMGGVINIITKGGDFRDEPGTSGWTRLGVSSVDSGTRGAFGLTAADEKTALSLSAAHLNVDDYETGHGEALKDSGTSQASFHLQARRKLGDDHVISARLQRDRREEVWYLASRDDVEKAGRREPDGLNTHYSPYQTRDRYELAWQGDFAGAWAPRAEATVYRQRLERGNYDYNEERKTDFRKSDTEFVTDGARAQVELVPSASQVLLVGAEAWETRASPVSHIGLQPNYDPGDRRMELIDDAVIQSVGAFVQEEIRLGDVMVTAGARYDTVEGTADGRVNSQGGMKTDGLDSTDYNLSWSLGANWSLARAFRPYASLAEGYRSASLIERYLNYQQGGGYALLPDAQLDPERNLSLELGARGDAGPVSYQVAAYESRIRDYIGARIIDPNNNIKQMVNLDEARIRGFETSLDVRLGGGATAFLNGTWIQGENEDDRFDEPLYQMPAPEATLGVERRADTGWQGRAAVRAVDQQDRLADQFSNDSERETAGYATLDLSVGWRTAGDGLWKTSEWTLAVHNALDKGYREHINEMTAKRAEKDRVQDLWAPGRNIALTWYAEF
ncbi:hemoglobin/transferrin/lactoferrin receptor protein [Thiohalospira halophila DSM 15071]|uniref:Hemoglobin/transferrin/lactoferrin receptor protein n=1 Tax=Thiohalospira halophila DSM 15071 TaxID=1123397 RepID=A0A1I1Q324_9GAMM|nr:TonB-dependent receptor [Thiohalospira halophila]SFD16362.1 hemoglobin/transferrin/lactoferrin receptor protein [Thiohalospira halophila DSM 15071]